MEVWLIRLKRHRFAFLRKNRWFHLLKFIKKAVKYLPFQSREFFRWKKPR
ncbi:hypothetical protein HMPREF9444_00287 [Succinatimonas hippei YIT 12066]|uniref:Uncharacterized protein n=1 Tax=Succinatimonas hippei (strain DSM 22608 / JCM 16073 / KCTC 15190 / YIT 12066) TaxID=762983 RepID=E8LHX4_SUCHY|nr:hypothetical protein HMPREF9444_00287 [Succinatimonas hippei YIT 12066]